MSEERVGGVYVEAYVKNLDEAERQLRDFEARAATGMAGGGGPGGGGAGYHVGGGGAGASAGRPNPLLDEFMGLGGGGEPVLGGGMASGDRGGGAGYAVGGGGSGGGGGGGRKRAGGGGGYSVSWPKYEKEKGPWTAGGALVGKGESDTPSFDAMRTWTAGGGNVGKGESESFQGMKTWTAGGGLVGRGESDTAATQSFGAAPGILPMSRMLKNEEDIAKESEKAKGSWRQYSIGIAYAARHLIGGGPAQMAGGALGLAAGAAFGPHAAYLGMVGGGAIGEGVQSLYAAGSANVSGAGLGSPGLAFQRDRAEADRKAAEGRQYTFTYKAGTELERKKADFAASGGKNVLSSIWNTMVYDYQWAESKFIDIKAWAQGVNVKPGAGINAAPNPALGQFFSGGDDLWKSVASAALQTTAMSEQTELLRQIAANTGRLFSGTAEGGDFGGTVDGWGSDIIFN